MPSPAGISGFDASSRALDTVLASLEDSKAENIVPIDIQGKSPLGDHMVIASGRSHRHVAAVADHLLKALKDAGLGNARVEGLASGRHRRSPRPLTISRPSESCTSGRKSSMSMRSLGPK